MEQYNKRRHSYNYGLALIKMLMCFEVVLIHFWNGFVPLFLVPFDMLKGVAVPAFMFLSFYLTEHFYQDIKPEKVKRRIWRVIYPQIGWALLYWLVYTLLQIKINLGVTITDLIWQILTGHSFKLNPSMWFQTVLIFLTIIYLIIFKLLSKNKAAVLISLLAIVAIVMQYSGLNKMLFDSLRYELKFPLGRFLEMVPYASLGFLCSYFNIFRLMKKYRYIFIILLGVVSIFLLRRIIIPSAPGFGYSQNNNILLVVFLVGFAYLLPFEKLPDTAKLFLKKITSYTLGIYCMHRLVAKLLMIGLSILSIEMNSFVICVAIYNSVYLVMDNV